MKNLITLILLLFTTISFSQEMTVLYLNSDWNYRNDYKGVNNLKRATILKSKITKNSRQALKMQ